MLPFRPSIDAQLARRLLMLRSVPYPDVGWGPFNCGSMLATGPNCYSYAMEEPFESLLPGSLARRRGDRRASDAGKGDPSLILTRFRQDGLIDIKLLENLPDFAWIVSVHIRPDGEDFHVRRLDRGGWSEKRGNYDVQEVRPSSIPDLLRVPAECHPGENSEQTPLNIVLRLRRVLSRERSDDPSSLIRDAHLQPARQRPCAVSALQPPTALSDHPARGRGRFVPRRSPHGLLRHELSTVPARRRLPFGARLVRHRPNGSRTAACLGRDGPSVDPRLGVASMAHDASRGRSAEPADGRPH